MSPFSYPKLPFILESGSEFRKFCYALVESSWFSSTILVVILINTVFIGIQTSEEIVARSGETQRTNGLAALCTV